MRIQASCKYNYPAIRAFTWVGLYGRRNPKKTFVLRMFLSALFLGAALYVFFALQRDASSYLLLFCGVLLFVLFLTGHCLLPRMTFRNLGMLKDAVNEYTFTETALKATASGAAYRGEIEIPYALLEKAVQSSQYLFLYENKNQAFLVDLRTVTGGQPEELCSLLQTAMQKKYRICKY